MYAACGTRDSVIPKDSQALISAFLRNRLKPGQFIRYLSSSKLMEEYTHGKAENDSQ